MKTQPADGNTFFDYLFYGISVNGSSFSGFNTTGLSVLGNIDFTGSIIDVADLALFFLGDEPAATRERALEVVLVVLVWVRNDDDVLVFDLLLPAEIEGDLAGDAPESKAGKPKEKAGKDDLDRFLDKALEGKQGTSRLKLTPADLKRFGGMERIMERLKERSGLRNPSGQKGKPKEEDPKSAEDAEKFLKDLLGDALKGGGQLKMTPELREQLQKLGGDEGMQKMLQKVLQKMLEEMDPDALGGLLGRGEPRPDPFFASSMKALKCWSVG